MSSPALAALFRAAVTGAMFVLAMIGFLQVYPAGPHGRDFGDFANIAYKAVQLCAVQFPDDLRNIPLPLSLQIARFALPLAAAWVTLSIAWSQLRNRVRLAEIRLRGDHLVVFGEGALAQGVVAGERARRGRVLAWASERGSRLADTAESLGGAQVTGKADADLKKLSLENARAFVAAGDNDLANLDAAKRALEYAVDHRKGADPLAVIARVDDVALHGTLEGRFSRHADRDRVQLRLASLPQLTARRFLLANPIDRLVPVKGTPLRLIWVGWSPVAERMLVRILGSAHYRDGLFPELIVADLNAARAEAAFRSRRPGAAQVANVRFVVLEDDAASLVAGRVRQEAQAGPLSAVYVTLTDSSAALSTALAIEEALERDGTIAPPIYVHTPTTSSEGAGVQVTPSAVEAFGSIADLADPETLLQERQDEVARSIHDFYLQGRLDEGESLGDRISLAEWEELPEQVRDDNRLVADCYAVKLRDLGARIVEGKGASFRFTQDEVEALSRAEHGRWMAAKLLDGWVHGETRDDKTLRHPDIVPYDKLSERVKDLDREQVRMIPRILAASGRRAVRDFRVLLETSAGPPASVKAVNETLAKLAESHPDCAVVVMGRLVDPAHRTALSAAVSGGAISAVILQEPAAELLQSLPKAERDEASRLYRDSDRLYADQLPEVLEALADAKLVLGAGGGLILKRPATDALAS